MVLERTLFYEFVYIAIWVVVENQADMMPQLNARPWKRAMSLCRNIFQAKPWFLAPYFPG